MLVDFHCHSNASDGEYPPEGLAERMAAAGVRFAALTDHNTTAGQDRFRVALERHGVGCVSGVELSVFSPEGPLHLLAYGFDPQHPRFASARTVIRSPFDWMWRRMVARLRASLGGQPATAENDSASDISGLRFTQGRLEFADAASLIHEAGGLAVLAHPLTRTTEERLSRLLHVLPPLGLDGIEAFYQPYSADTCRGLLERAEALDLLVTAGSDYHGPHSHHGTHPGMELPEAHAQRFLQAVQAANRAGIITA